MGDLNQESDMWTKQYGRTGEQISVISFGGMRFANPDDIEANAEVVLHAYKKGINYFDTAPGYCRDRSEDIIGAAVRQMKPGTFYLSTKSSDTEGGAVRTSLEKSLKRFNVEKIDFYHIWCVITLDQWADRLAGGAVDAVLDAKEEGLIEHVAISSHLSGKDLKQVLKEGPFEGVTLGYCAINFPYRDEAVKAAGEMGLGVVTMNPLGGGLIPRNPERLDFIRSAEDPSVVAAALRFNVSNPDITSALVGFTTTEHVDQAVAAIEDFKPYDAGHITAMREKILEAFEGLCTGCGYCLPCPEDVAIPKLMEAYNHKLLGDGDPQQITNRLAWHWDLKPQAAKACSLCGTCEERCTQRLPIPDRMKEIASLSKPPHED